MSDKIILGYWNTPGKAQPSRYLLELSGVKYEEVRYSYPAAEWFGRDKYALGLPFPNLPYLLDGEVKITESETIFDYLIQRLNKVELLGQGNDKYIVDNLKNLFSDIGTRMYIYSQKEGEEQTKFLSEQILPKIRDIHKFLGQKEYLLGYFTAADLYFLCFAKGFKNTLPDSYNEFAATFNPLIQRLENIPQIAKYISEGRHP
ncbi:glutathione S-transferase, amine-terminal domain protein (macronuclear) [Tetrahymena thermophila SB210]|uniref:glutathione transferase n=1 Tax=Tetrahymena thermophila (strain SB210) TaxID=312017 RepID=Q24I53_TETTS|nr:glutathione S-transferase, amine-terminal domain protein [Tetrahymena thermophila SB210]EAS07385.1 glutathione S-transferase, amine-terminal domain protein [Tetrahymena thermophila SB210]|eukprot:XP_001027627.1 glutathione S-transferase, amine-terminal domain protein [Tetrahymena thermophila SB210]